MKIKCRCIIILIAIALIFEANYARSDDTNPTMAQYFYESAEQLRHYNDKYKLERMEIKLRAALRLNPRHALAHKALLKVLTTLGNANAIETAAEEWLTNIPQSTAADYYKLLSQLTKIKSEKKKRMELLNAFIKRHSKKM